MYYSIILLIFFLFLLFYTIQQKIISNAFKNSAKLCEELKQGIVTATVAVLNNYLDLSVTKEIIALCRKIEKSKQVPNIPLPKTEATAY